MSDEAADMVLDGIRGLAGGWAAWHEYDAAIDAWIDAGQGSIVPRPNQPHCSRLSADELGALLGWVAREMALVAIARTTDCAGSPECTEKRPGEHGWVRRITGWSRCASCWDREALAHHIATKLGGPFVCEECEGLGYLTMSPQGERYGCPECQSGREADVSLARELCEAACPSGQPAAT